jgi:hypothetical protein
VEVWSNDLKLSFQSKEWEIKKMKEPSRKQKNPPNKEFPILGREIMFHKIYLTLKNFH